MMLRKTIHRSSWNFFFFFFFVSSLILVSFSFFSPRSGAEGLCLLPPRSCGGAPGYMSGQVSSSHWVVSSSKTRRPCAPLGARYMGQPRMTWSAVCSSTPHSQAAEGVTPHLCIFERNRPTPVRRRFSRTQASLGKGIPLVWEPTLGMKARSLVEFVRHSALQL